LILTTVFTRLGHQPVAVDTGEKAVELALQEPHPEIIVLDWIMPGISGPEAAQQIRANEARMAFRPYIIVLTASGTARRPRRRSTRGGRFPEQAAGCERAGRPAPCRRTDDGP